MLKSPLTWEVEEHPQLRRDVFGEIVMFKKKLIVYLIVLAFGGSAFAATRTWDGGGDGTNWSSANNWNPNGVPTGSDAGPCDARLPVQDSPPQ